MGSRVLGECCRNYQKNILGSCVRKMMIPSCYSPFKLITPRFYSHAEPTQTDHVQKRPRSRIPVINWFYDDLLNGRVKFNAFFLYAGITKQINYMEFFRVFNMPDTFNSWFLITELHVWMLMARLRGDGKDGRTATSCIVKALWDDVTSRAKALSPGDSSISKKQIQELVNEFRASILIYDEGLLGSDTLLASSLWYRFFGKECDDPRLLELLTGYVRFQMQNLESTSKEKMLLEAAISWKALPKDL